MSLGRRQAEQKSMRLSYDKLPQTQGHVFYERLQKLLHRKHLTPSSKSCALPFTPKNSAANPSHRVQFGDPAAGLVWFWRPHGLGRCWSRADFCPNWPPEPAHIDHLAAEYG